MLVAAWNCTKAAGCHNATIYVTRAPSWKGPYEVVSKIPYSAAVVARRESGRRPAEAAKRSCVR